MASILKYPVGIQTFEKIRREGYLYVDKTAYIYNLATTGAYYFLSRPRRFGKSLLLSTIESFFRGERDLFEGLDIYSREWDWVEYPVFHMALNGQDYNSVGNLDEILHSFMSAWETEYDLPRGNNGQSPSVRFMEVIRNASLKTGRHVVILIDEYDQPLLQNIEEGKEELHNTLRVRLQAFYSVMKAQDRYIKFVMLSGISKFSKLSVFSGLNNLKDISLEIRFNAICGINETELFENFRQGISNLSYATGSTEEETLKKLKKEFDGYHFSNTEEDIYNPYSILNTFDNERFGHYWFESGTPSFLISLLRSRHWDLARIGGVTCPESDLRGSDIYLTNPIPLLYQSGYLTIKGYNCRFNDYYLDYPNEEVSEGFANDLLKVYSCNKKSDEEIKQFVRYVEEGDADGFMRRLKSLLSDIPYDQILDKELHYENMMYLIMKLMGFYTHTEYRTSNGRIDMVVETDRYVYIMEFKLHGTAEDALSQIREKEYALPFARENRELMLIGASFDDEKRNLGTWKVEKLKN